MSEIIKNQIPMNQIPMNNDVKFSPEDIAAILGQYPPTPEQAKIIASPKACCNCRGWIWEN